jgi:hypothetical protein
MRTLLAALVLCSASLVSAQPAPTKTPDATTMHADDCARARALHKTCVLDIKGDDIEGGVDKPSGSVFSAREWVSAGSLVHIRRDFIVEILKTAEDL